MISQSSEYIFNKYLLNHGVIIFNRVPGVNGTRDLKVEVELEGPILPQ